ncbi:MAG: hypothetical protein DRJ10_05360 [Bacteroidetes bacterium]|nr:MAG: hypothetical protein DRJ10_05360 [Bacteroidota bacterium]
MKKNLFFILLLVSILGFLLNSCATIFSGTGQVINFSSNPQGAEVIVNGSSINQITPCHIELPRKVKVSKYNLKNEYTYVFRKDGYNDVKVQDYRKINEIVWINCMTTVFALFTIPIDFITGAAYYYTDEINVKLPKDEKIRDIIPPIISIVSPSVKRGFKHIVDENDLIIRLKVKDESIVSFVSVDDIKILENEYGFYQINLRLKNGLNTVNIKAIDNRDNVANEVFTVELKGDLSNSDFIVSDKHELIGLGEYYALIIGVQDYDDPSINDLDNPIQDAEKIYSVLSEKYNFKQENITFLKNPTNNKITLSMEYYFDNLSENDNLLIFYAGHGFWDKKFKQGYWLPSDAVRSNRGTWLANSLIRDYMRGIPTKHSLLITDACFSGGIFKTREAFPDASKAINKLYALPSRKAMTSGALSEVPDKSVFIEYLVKRLEQNNQKHLSSEQLFASFKLAVINNSPNSQVPQYGEVRGTGDEGGDFIFIKK